MRNAEMHCADAFKGLRFLRKTNILAAKGRRIAERAPHALEITCVGVKHDDAVIAVTVRNK